MNLISEWKHILKHAWSFRLAIVAGLFSGAEVILPLFVDALPRGVFAGASLLAAVGSAVSRVVDQPKMERRKVARTSPDFHRGEYD